MAGAAVAYVLHAGSGDDGADPSLRSHAPELSLVGDGEIGGNRDARVRVLVVEDDAAMALLCRFNLELAGFEVATATSGAEGLELASAGSYDVVLLDVMLPDLGGFDLAQLLSDTPVVFLSARASEADIERGRDVGGIDYIVKPFDPVGLPERLRADLEELERGGPEGVWQLRFGPGRM
jgi:DNA-binding response OmpR family regulator